MTVTFYELGAHAYEEIGIVDDGEIIDGEDQLEAIGADQFLNDEERLLRVYDGPHIIAGIGTNNTGITKSDTDKWSDRARVRSVFKEWVPYTGERGGEGWQNTLTGEIRYQEQKPSGAGSDDADVTLPSNSTMSTVTAAVTSILGATVASALKDQLRGGEGGTLNPQMYVTAAALYIAQTGKGSLANLQESINQEAEDEPENAQDITVNAGGHEVEMTTATDVSDITGAITEVTGNETVPRLAMTMDEDEQKNAEAWTENFLQSVDDETAQEFQGALDQRIRERTVSTDKFRGGVVVPNDITPETAENAMYDTLDYETYEMLAEAIRSNPSADETDPDTWVRATLTQIGDDNNQRQQFQSQFDVSVAETDEEPKMVTMTGGGESIEMPTNTAPEDARRAIEDTFSEEALKLTAHALEQREMNVEDPKNWVMTSLTLAQVNNPEGFGNQVTELQDSLIDEGEDEDEGDLSRSEELLDDFEPEGDWQAYTDPVSDLLEEGESGSDIVDALRNYGTVGDHALEDNQIRQIAFDAYDDATERNAPIEETADNPTLAMDWGNEFPEAMQERQRELFADFELVKEGISAWSDDPHGPEMASMWNYVMNHTGNGNIPEGVQGEPDEDQVQALTGLHSIHQDTLQEVYGDTVPVFRPVTGSAATELTNAKDADDDEPIEFNHRPAESWSSDIEQIANRTDFEDEEVAVVRRDVPTSDVLASSLLGSPGFDADDNQFMVMSESRTEYEKDDVLTGDDLQDPNTVMEQVQWAADTAGGGEDSQEGQEGDSE